MIPSGFPYYRLINIGWFPSFPYYRRINVRWLPSLKIKKCGVPLLENRKVTRNPFHVFDRSEIHIQAFLDSINGKFIISDPHLHIFFFGNRWRYFMKIRCSHIPKKNMVPRTYMFRTKSIFWVPYLQRLYLSRMFPYFSYMFWSILAWRSTGPYFDHFLPVPEII